jgi:hypothetical protein
MTDRLRHLTVTLERDLREDDAEGLLRLIRAIKGVASVTYEPVTVTDYMAREVVATEHRQRLHEAIEDIFSGQRGEDRRRPR